MKKVPYGIINYELLQTEGYEYIDKTMYLEKLEDVGRTLIYLRPGRFGKSLFTSMMSYYYDVNASEKFDSLFGDTYVGTNPTSEKNSYYILKFDFSGITTLGMKIEDFEANFKACVISGIENFLNNYSFKYEINTNEDIAVILKYFLSFVYGLKLENKIYILVDEYDNFTNGILEGNADIFLEVVGKNGFIKSFYAVIKEYIGLGVVGRFFATGICPVTLDSMTSGFNIATDISGDEEFNSMIGLTHKEVLNMLNGIPEKQKIFDLMVKHYDGYLFNKRAIDRVFNATLTMYFMKELERFERMPDEFIDKNTVSNYGKIENLIKLQNNPYYEEIIDTLLKTGEITGKLKNNFNLELEFTRDDIISLLYYFGYLTIKDDAGNGFLQFKVPNKVMIETYNNFFIKILSDYNIQIDGLRENDSINEIVETGSIESITKYVEELLKNCSNRIFIKFDEKYIQLMYYTLLKSATKMNIHTEYECNNGYIDLYLTPKTNEMKQSVMIELKYIKKSDYNESLLEEKKNEAKSQLERYSEDERIDKNTIKYIIIFVGDELKVLEECK